MYSDNVKGHFLVYLYFWILSSKQWQCPLQFFKLISRLGLNSRTLFAEIPHFFFFFYKMYKYFVNIWTLYMDSYI